MSELEQLQDMKRAMYNDAKEHISNIALCCRELGERMSHNYGPKYLLHVDGMAVFVDDYGHYMTVRRADGKTLCSTHPCEMLFASGDWYKPITDMVDDAKAKVQSRMAAYEAKETARLREQLTS